MDTQWQLYQALELIPESVPYPQPSLFARLLAPLRRSFADTFVRDLSARHQVLLFKRCLSLGEDAARSSQDGRDPQQEAIAPDPILDVSQPTSHSFLTPPQQQVAQEWLSRGGQPWWTWYDS